MDLGLTAVDRDFRRDVRAFIAEALPPAARRKLTLGHFLAKEDVVGWQRILNRQGWAVPQWPSQFGGTGWTPVQQHIFSEEMYRAPAPEPLSQNVKMVGPVIIEFGTDEQKRRFLPRIANLDYWFCQGFSEPGAGSDLAALRTAARRDGNDYVLDGQKIWTTGAHKSDWMFCLVRTSFAGRKQDGISFLLVDMATPGVTVQRIETIDGGNELNEVFFDGARVPRANLIGEENKGWATARFLLANERTNVARVGLTRHRLRRVREIAGEIIKDDRPLADDPTFRSALAELEIELKTLEMMQLRVLSDHARQLPGAIDPRSSLLKLKGSELQQRSAELLMKVAGPFALADQSALTLSLANEEPVGPDWAGGIAPTYFFSRAASIFGGSNEIQRNIMARTILGL